jgi:hypothetical protein
VLYFLGAPNGSWVIALGFQIFTLLVTATCYLQYRRTYIGVTDVALVERGFFGRTTSYPLSSLGRAILVRTYRSSSTETLDQLLVNDGAGNRLLRMRGMFWTKLNMTTIVRAADITLTDLEEPMTSKAFFEEYAGSAYWFENSPTLAVLAIVGLIVVVLAIVVGLMSLMGIPIVG